MVQPRLCQEQGPDPEQWGTIRLGSGPVKVQCESFHTVSYNPFVPGPCPDCGSGQSEDTVLYFVLSDYLHFATKRFVHTS